MVEGGEGGVKKEKEKHKRLIRIEGAGTEKGKIGGEE